MTRMNDTNEAVRCETCGAAAKKLHELCDACILKMMLKKQREDEDSTAIKECECQRCGKRWMPRSSSKPRTCPNQHCRSVNWDRPRIRPSKKQAEAAC